MLTMRLYLRKLVALCGILTILWIIVSYSSTVDVPSAPVAKGNAGEIENRIDKIQKQMYKEFQESSKLLERVKQHLSKTEKTAKEDNRINSNEFDEYKNADGIESDMDVAPGPASLVLPVLLIACDRVTVNRCLDKLVKYRPNKEMFPIIVSQDCGHNATYHVIKSYVDKDPTISVVQQPDLSEIPLPRAKIKFRGYYKIARHYRFALNYVFKTQNHEAVIIVEDDLDISPDFFEYFLGTYPLLLKDPTLWCISAWNDNGKEDVIDSGRPELLHRTDFFPGLGWTLRRQSWLDLEPRWPPAFFDDWLRDPENTKGKACIRPEVSRTYSFGKVGVSKGLFFEMHLRHMKLNSVYVEFTKLNLTYLLKENYDQALTSAAYSAELLSPKDMELSPGSSPARVPYSDAKSYRRAAKALGLMDDFRSGIPRTAYMGIVQCHFKGRRVYLAPDYTWIKYDPTWG